PREPTKGSMLSSPEYEHEKSRESSNAHPHSNNGTTVDNSAKIESYSFPCSDKSSPICGNVYFSVFFSCLCCVTIEEERRREKTFKRVKIGECAQTRCFAHVPLSHWLPLGWGEQKESIGLNDIESE